ILHHIVRLVCLSLSFAGLVSGKALLFQVHAQDDRQEQPVAAGPDGRLVYLADSSGNRVPDFSHAGYRAGVDTIPEAIVKIHVRAPQDSGDATRLIQAAIDYVAGLTPDAHGLRGAVLLGPGMFRLNGQLHIHTSGVVLRGSGMMENGTVLLGVGSSRRPLVVVAGRDDRVYSERHVITDSYVPVNAGALTVSDPTAFKRGDRVLITRPSTDEWIQA